MAAKITISLAGHRIEFIEASGGLIPFFENYRAPDDAEPEFTVKVSYGFVNGTTIIRGGEQSRFILTHKAISDFLIEKQVLTFHASALCYDGKAYLFSAPSGTGKSTHTRLWRERFGEKVVMISDDQPFIGFDENGRAICYGSPYNGKEKLGANIEAPIGGICVCSRGSENLITRLSSAEAVLRLSPNAYFPKNMELASNALAVIKRLAETVPVYDHSFNMEPTAAEYAMRRLVKGE